MREFFELVINQPLGYLIKVIYDWIPNYGAALIVFTVVTKLLLLPLGIKQHKSMMKMQSLQPVLKQLQQKYKDDPQKLNVETMKVYKERKINPFGGCLPLVVQMIILFGLIGVVYNPIKYIRPQVLMPIVQEQGEAATLQENEEIVGPAEVDNTQYADAQMQQEIQDALSSNNATAKIEVARKYGIIHFDFFGIDLASVPSYKRPNILWILPLLAALTTFLSSKLMQRKQGQQSAQAGSMETMTTIMPFMTLFFAFSLPGAMSLYWTISSVTQCGQQMILNAVYKPLPVVVMADDKGETGPKRKKLVRKGGKKK